MKKILAAVLAAAMALSMSAVAFAEDTNSTTTAVGDAIGGTANGAASTVYAITQTMGNEGRYLVTPDVLWPDVPSREKLNERTEANNGTIATKNLIAIDGTPGKNAQITSAVLADLMKKGLVTVDVAVSSGKPNLKSTPAVKVNKDNLAYLSVTFDDTWGVKDVTAQMRIRITAKKDVTVANAFGGKVRNSDNTKDVDDNTVLFAKGNTITFDPFDAKGVYYGVTAYGENMTITPKEVADKYIIAAGEELYNHAGADDKVIIYFGGNYDVAAFETRISQNQSNVNLAYTLEPVKWVDEMFGDDIEELEYITFRSSTAKFNYSGTMYFNAIGGIDTCVYKVTDDGLELIADGNSYDAVDGTVYAKNIKTLGSYVISPEPLSIEEEPAETPSEPAEVDNTPVNPGTGAL